jgi:glycosyltransferase involved in cell wall biosynthesis
VVVYCRAGYYADRIPEFEGVRRVFYPAPEHKSAGQFVHSLFGVLDAAVRRPDIVYLHTLPSGPHSLLPWLLGQRVVFNVNGMDWARAKWGPIGKAYFHAAVRIVLRTARAIVNDSEAMRAYYLERFGRDSRFIAYGAEIDTTSRPELLAPYGLAPRSYYLIASRLVPENNADLIIQAFLRSRSQRQLIVAGRANYRSPWVDAVLATNDPRVRFLGHVEDAAVVRELHVSSYAYLHGHSLGGTNPALLKALGAGNCIVALDTPFNREVLIGNGGREYGVLFPRDVDALRQAIDAIDAEPDRAAALRERAPDRIREAYTWDHITDQYEQLFREVARGLVLR